MSLISWAHLSPVPPVGSIILPHLRGTIAWFALALTGATMAYTQVPQISSAGIVNAASYAQPISPGSLVSIFGTNLAAARATATGLPLPTGLMGTSVSVNGVTAPLLFVSAGQINLEIPSAASACYGCGEFAASLVVTTVAGSSAAVQVPISVDAPAVFTMDASGCGQADALNVAPDGSISQNSLSNSAAPGDYISLFGTGFGPVYSPPTDGTAAKGPQGLEFASGVTLGFLTGTAPASANITPTYAGLAPTLVGVDQMNFQIPKGAPEGCAVPVVIAGLPLSPTISLSIHTGRGQCSDPPVQSYGQISLTKTIASGTSADGESDTFPSGPGMPAPQPQPPPAAPGGYVANTSPPSFISAPVASRACPVAGYADLSAGPITISSATMTEWLSR